MLLFICKWFYASLDRSLQQEMFLFSCKRFYASLDESVQQGTNFVGRKYIFNLPSKISTGMCRAHLCGDDSSHSQSQSGKRLLLASKGHPMRTLLYHGSCIDPTHQSHTLDLTSEAPILRNPVPIQLLIKDMTKSKVIIHFRVLLKNYWLFVKDNGLSLYGIEYRTLNQAKVPF